MHLRVILLLAAGILAMVAVLSASAHPASAQARQLHWPELAVSARLDADGRLRVVERQVMVFTGDWNGGERVFRLARGHDLDFESITRIDADGTETRLDQGDLSVTNNYDWTDSRTLRWRSRQPDDPPFDHTTITYILVYQLANILEPHGGSYLLDHDFAFTDREGDIDRFTLDLAIHPKWKAEARFASHMTAGPLRPGQGFVVSIPLHYTGVGRPAGVLPTASPTLRRALVAIMLGLGGTLLVRLFRRERSLGRFAPVPAAESLDPDWIAEHVLTMKPEVIGATYDTSIGSAEVAAVIARMVAEKKISSRAVRRKAWIFPVHNLELTLLVDRDQLRGYERALIDKLFFAGHHTSTERIREHYRKTGFDPSTLIREPLTKEVQRLRGISEDQRHPSIRPLIPLALLTVGTLVGAGLHRSSELLLMIPIGIGAGVFLTLFSALHAYFWRRNVTHPAMAALRFLVPLGIGIGIILVLILARQTLSTWGAIALALLGVTMTAIVTRAGRSPDPPEGIALRKRLAAAKRYFAAELGKEHPRLEDAWFPYVIAFDLGRNADRWFRAFGGESAGVTSMAGSGSFGSSGSGGWSGGGGAFGGAGASGTWIAATGALAAGVATPSSSSSSGGGGGGGGGSSGGGGGGGW